MTMRPTDQDVKNTIDTIEYHFDSLKVSWEAYKETNNFLWLALSLGYAERVSFFSTVLMGMLPEITDFNIIKAATNPTPEQIEYLKSEDWRFEKQDDWDEYLTKLLEDNNNVEE